MNLRSLTFTLRLCSSYTRFGLLAFVDLMYSFFPHLKELTVYVVEQPLKGGSNSANAPSLKRVTEEFST
jgi:hypothetical protein